ncbi:PAS domain S-box protein [Fusibacter paucivorans]|uniref:Stage 0 sporulation protein A homolog n=1 Tax=Fusibacter paucivorans TaxID=76009 RepID=A0ABS5PKL4_9FIRM|nr:PAS domain S-box protein [Fusibacter paucivorans]MBS7525715.1 PAS domain S-box protein [Fusibacter paucivorans]
MKKIEIANFISLMDNAGDAVTICDSEARIAYCNNEFSKLVGVEREIAVGSKLDDMTRLYRGTGRIKLCESIEGRQNIQLLEGIELESSSGERTHVTVTASVSDEDCSAYTYAIVIIKNIEKLHQARANADMYSNLVEQSHISMIITDLRWRVQYCNPYYQYKYLGERNQINGDDILERLFPNANEDFREMIVFYVEQLGSWTSEERFDLANNEYAWEEIQIQAVRDSYGNMMHYTIMMKDITNRKHTELYIEQEKQTFEAIFENTTVGLLIIDERGIILKTNMEALRIFNAEIQKIVNASFYNLFICTQNSDTVHYKCNHCENCIIAKTLERVMEKDMTIRGQEVIYAAGHKDSKNDEKTVRYLRMNASPAVINQQKHILVALQDITDMKRMSRELIHSERHLRMITNSMLDTIVQINSDNIITYASPSVKQLTGYDVGEIIGRDFRKFVIEKDLESHEVREGITKEFQANTTAEFQIETKFGEERWSQSVGSILKYEEDVSYVFVIRDITEQVEYRKKLQASKNVADEANAAKSLFLANMSHEIRTPMNGIIGMTELTLMTELSPVQKQYLEMVKTSATSLLNIINSILDFSKIEAGKMEADEHIFNFASFINETLMPLRIQAMAKHIKFEFERLTQIPDFLIGDAAKIRQILNNIIYNAIKFTDEGHVAVKISGVNTEGMVFKLKICVEDTGIGISEENQAKIFESFNQADPSATRKYGGTGLGLSISKGLIELLGGRLTMSSELGKGTTMVIDLPMVIGNAFGPIGDNQKIEIPEVSKKLSVLVAEDDEVNQIVVSKLLNLQGHKADITSNGRDAVNLFRDQHYDLVIMDIQMKTMNGIEAMKAMRRISKEQGVSVPIVAFTAHALSEDEAKLKVAGFDDYIAKPVSLKNFFRVIMKNTGMLEEQRFNVDEIMVRIQQEEALGELALTAIQEKIEAIDDAITASNFAAIEMISGQLKHLVKNHTALRRIVLKMELAIRKENIEAFETYFQNFKENLGR